MTDTSFPQRLIDKLGPDAVITTPDDIAPWLSDWRGMYTGHAQAVVRPSSTEDVAAALTLCSEARVPVVPRGGNTGLCSQNGGTPIQAQDAWNCRGLRAFG